MSHSLLNALGSRGWTVRPATKETALLPPAVARRYRALPPDVVAFLSSVEVCQNQAQTSWFLTAQDYRRKKGSGFRWNEYEYMALETMQDDPRECAAIKSFWDSHFPFMLAVHSDYDYLAVSLLAEESGCIVHGHAPEWEDPSPIAPSFTAFLEGFAIAASSPQPEYPLNIFL